MYGLIGWGYYYIFCCAKHNKGEDMKLGLSEIRGGFKKFHI